MRAAACSLRMAAHLLGSLQAHRAAQVTNLPGPLALKDRGHLADPPGVLTRVWVRTGVPPPQAHGELSSF